MSVFESELKKGRFVVGECSKCQKVTWPPNDFCSHCFGEISWRDVKKPGIIVECSSKDGRTFCIVEFENTVRVMGIILGNTEPKPGEQIKVISCSFDDSPKFTFGPEKSDL
jgi:uncharacterized OB-fold protein